MELIGQEGSFIEIVKTDNYSIKVNTNNQTLKLELPFAQNPETNCFEFCFDSLKESNKLSQKVSDFEELVNIIKESVNMKVDLEKMEITAYLHEANQNNGNEPLTLKFETKNYSKTVLDECETKYNLSENLNPIELKSILFELIKEIKELKRNSESNFEKLTELIIKNQTKEMENESETKLISIVEDLRKDVEGQISEMNISIAKISKTQKSTDQSKTSKISSIPTPKKLSTVEKKIETPKIEAQKKEITTTNKLKGTSSNLTSGEKKVEEEVECGNKKVKKTLIESKNWVHPNSYYYKKLNLKDNTIYHCANLKKTAYVFGPEIINEIYELTFIVNKFEKYNNYFGVCDIAHLQREEIYQSSNFINIIGMSLNGCIHINNVETDTPHYYEENVKIKMSVNFSQGSIEWEQESNHKYYRHEWEVLKDKSITWAPFFWLDGRAKLTILK